MRLRYIVLSICLSCAGLAGMAQSATLRGTVTSAEGPLELAVVSIKDAGMGTHTDSSGNYQLERVPTGKYSVKASYLGFAPMEMTVELKGGTVAELDFNLMESAGGLDDVVITGTLKPVRRMESSVPVEVYLPAFFRKNPTPNVYEALQNVNGVRPQLNCNICNTGDIHINGLEGPYTMVLIDGMPIISSLASVYGLSGIPNSLIERMEIVKGPASSLYGSEAIGGLINIITKSPSNAPRVTADAFATSWGEYNADLGLKFKLGPKISVLTGTNYFNFENIVDKNGDNFTDMTLQERVSVFQKWNFARKENRVFTMAGRFYYEDRWGGELDWTREFRGGDSIYGESIYTRRWEAMGNYQLPTAEKLFLSFSFNDHDQNSVYGNTHFLARQRIGFSQLTWDKTAGKHDLLLGAALRYTYYDDNTPATGGEAGSPGNDPDEVLLPGIFVQDEINLGRGHKTLLGFRYDYNSRHGNIFTPRLAHKWSITDKDILRLNAGTGFRVVNLFTEEHAALTGARDVVIAEELKPERSYNLNLNYLKKMYARNGAYVGLDLSAWYTYFTNLIIPDYETNANQIVYDNLRGHAITRGVSANLDFSFPFGMSILAGATIMDVYSVENGERSRQMLTERYTGTWAVTQRLFHDHLSIDYTGNIYGPMLLPLLGDLDPRNPQSPTWSIQNVQATYSGIKSLDIYCGVKNLLNWTPNKGTPFLIARAHDPFDKSVQFDGNGNVIATAENPYALSFDPSYVYGPNQGIRGFLGARYTFK